jgi:hypothetical protein
MPAEEMQQPLPFNMGLGSCDAIACAIAINDFVQWQKELKKLD